MSPWGPNREESPRPTLWRRRNGVWGGEGSVDDCGDVFTGPRLHRAAETPHWDVLLRRRSSPSPLQFFLRLCKLHQQPKTVLRRRQHLNPRKHLWLFDTFFPNDPPSSQSGMAGGLMSRPHQLAACPDFVRLTKGGATPQTHRRTAEECRGQFHSLPTSKPQATALAFKRVSQTCEKGWYAATPTHQSDDQLQGARLLLTTPRSVAPVGPNFSHFFLNPPPPPAPQPPPREALTPPLPRRKTKITCKTFTFLHLHHLPLLYCRAGPGQQVPEGTHAEDRAVGGSQTS